MRRNRIIVLMLAAISAPALGAPGDKNPQIVRIVEEVSAQRIEVTIRKLVSFHTRHTLSETESDTRGIGAARRWIKAELERCSAGTPLKVEFDDNLVPAGPRMTQPTHVVNVVATLPGTQPESRERIYVVSGHYDSRASDVMDSTSYAPGANDDASGTALSMELACVMSKHKFDATLVFMAVAGEEQGLLGAFGYAKKARAANVNVAGMFTNDIIGNTRGEDGSLHRGRVRLFAVGVPARKELPREVLDMLVTSGENDVPTRQLARFVKDAAGRYVPATRVDVILRRDRYLRGGDHIAFLDEGYPALRFTEPVEDWRRQHQDVRKVDGVQFGDEPEFVDYPYVAEVARINAAAMAALALAPSAPRQVEIEVVKLEMDTTLRWQPNPEPDVAGYRIVWRPTTAFEWQHSRDVGNVTRFTLTNVSKDDYLFAVQAYDRDGNLSVATYPTPTRDPGTRILPSRQ
ncbi:MAG: M28 family peptidase [Burkholderiales bacterium]|nr:M28 family peptidase [Burkholderiales bacterium]